MEAPRLLEEIRFSSRLFLQHNDTGPSTSGLVEEQRHAPTRPSISAYRYVERRFESK